MYNLSNAMASKVHCSLVLFIVLFSIPLLVWSFYINFDTVPKIDDILRWISFQAAADGMKVPRDEIQTQEDRFRTVRLLLQCGLSFGIGLSILILLRSITLILTVSGAYFV